MGRWLQTVFIISIFFYIFICCGKESRVGEKISTNEINKIKEMPDSEIFDFSYKFTDKGKLAWELFSEKAEIYKKNHLIKVNGVHLTFYNKDGSINTGVDSKYGVVYEDKHLLSAISNVVLRTSDGAVLYTDILFWDDNRKKLYTDSAVKIVRENGDIIEGIGLEADQKLEKVIIKRRVKGKIYENKR